MKRVVWGTVKAARCFFPMPTTIVAWALLPIWDGTGKAESPHPDRTMRARRLVPRSHRHRGPESTSPQETTAGPPQPRSIHLARWLGAGGAGLGVVVLIGWVIGHHGIKSILADAVEIKANTAIGLLLAGMALCTARRTISGRRDWPFRRSLSWCC